MEQVSTGVRARATLTCPPQSDPHVKLEWWIEGSQGDEQEPMEDVKTLIEEVAGLLELSRKVRSNNR